MQAQFVNHNLSDKLSAGTRAAPETELSLVIRRRVVAGARHRIGAIVEVHRSVQQERSLPVELRQGSLRAVLEEQHATVGPDVRGSSLIGPAIRAWREEDVAVHDRRDAQPRAKWSLAGAQRLGSVIGSRDKAARVGGDDNGRCSASPGPAVVREVEDGPLTAIACR